MLSAVNPEWLAFSYRMLTTTLKGVMLTLVAWVIISSILGILAKNNLGVEKANNWHTFSCKIAGASTGPSAPPSDQKCEVESISVQCETGSDKYIALSSDGKDKPDHYQLKAMATMKCKDRSGKATTTQKDVTGEALWEAADQTVVKMDKGMAATSAKPGITEVTAEHQGKLDSLQVYVDMCPLKPAGPGASDPGTLPVSLKSGGVSRVLGETASAAAPTCSACPPKDEETSCHFVAGNKDAENILVFARANGHYVCSAAKPLKGKWTLSSGQEQKDYSSRIQKTGEELINLLPSDVASSFAVYRSDQIVQVNDSVYGKDSGCPNRRFVSYGYVFTENKEDRACADIDQQIAAYGPKDIADARVVAHEQIGHAFGTFDDEYADIPAWEEIFRDGLAYGDIYARSLNCVSLKENGKCTAWDGSKSECVPGCQYADSAFYRFTDNSIMRDHTSGGFDENQKKVLLYRIKNGTVPKGSFLSPFHCVTGCVSLNHLGITNIPFSMVKSNLLDYATAQVNFLEGSNSFEINPLSGVTMQQDSAGLKIKHKDPLLRDRDYTLAIGRNEDGFLRIAFAPSGMPVAKSGREAIEDVFQIKFLYKDKDGKSQEFHLTEGDVTFSVFVK